ncbi:hypothetical protein C8N46_103415 [Kordia periserrulae]|uniref:Uncharacterized protein n=1 Tax=Kordia periserrulae TaxID=701523 RepID=A0A2T6C1W6_9FLAO|nr:hypothetical protein [Kordia periserrulae]PTX62315.1 hypothetical protein C8N46_103415 [Kordia periserrulae]
MTEQNCLNTVKQIEDYISRYRNDSDGSWEYQHTPYLEKSLTKLSKLEAKKLRIDIGNWSEFHLYEIADPILFCKNDELDDELYIKIFGEIKNVEYLDYLVGNVIHYIKPPYYSFEKINNWETELIQKLIINVSKLIEVKEEGLKNSLIEVIEFLTDSLKKRKIKNS